MMPFCDLRPHLTKLFLPAQPRTEFYFFPLHSQSAASLFAPHSPNGILFLTLHSPSAAPFLSPCSPERNFIFNTAYPPPARPFSPLKSPKENFIFNSAFPVCRDLFYPRAVPNGILFSHSTSIPLRRGPRLQRCITVFSVLSAAFHHAGHRVSQHAEYIQRSCPKCVAPRRNGEIFPPANATAATNRGAGTAIQDEYKKKPYPSARRGIYYTGIIGGGRGGRGYNNMEIWDGREAAGKIIIWKYMTAERRRGR